MSAFILALSIAQIGLQGDRWTGPWSLPRINDSGPAQENEIFFAALIPTGPRAGHVLLMREYNNSTPYPTYIIDPKNLPTSATFAANPCDTNLPNLLVSCVSGSDIGCPAASFDRNGRILTAGGHFPSCLGIPNEGSETANIFDPISLTWLEASGPNPTIPEMAGCRHYASGISLPNDPPPLTGGDLFVVIGGGPSEDTLEFYNINSNAWYDLDGDGIDDLDCNGDGIDDLSPTIAIPADLSTHDYSFTNLLPTGLFLSNPGKALTTSTPTWFVVPAVGGGCAAPLTFVAGPPRSAFIRDFTGYVQQDRPGPIPGSRTRRVILLGGRVQPQLPLHCEDVAATNTVEWIDNPAPGSSTAWSPPSPALIKARAYSKSVVLPNGQVAVLGGASHAYQQALAETECDVTPGDCASTLVTPVLEVEIYDPVTNTSTLRAAEPAIRAYHSVSLLLPDGRIFSAGGDSTQNHMAGVGCNPGADITIYRPPYMSKIGPSVLSVAPLAATRGGTFTIDAMLPPNTTASKVTLTAPGISTHNIESKERYIELEFQVVSSSGSQVQIQADIPFHIWGTQPGHYMLWVVASSGGVSKATFVHIQ